MATQDDLDAEGKHGFSEEAEQDWIDNSYKGVIEEPDLPPEIARDAEVFELLCTHKADPNAHHVPAAGVTAHYELTDLTGDCHPDHLNNARGDARYLYKENVAAFTPDGDYEPATKKYVDDSAGSATLAGLTDVVITGPADLDLLQYDAASSKWVDRSLAEAGVAAASHKDRHDPEDGADPLDTAAPPELVGVQASGVGSAHSFARSDHQHQIQHSIADNHIVTIDDADAANLDYTRFTASGLEGRSYSQVLSDLSGQAAGAFSWNTQSLTGIVNATLSGYTDIGEIALPGAPGANTGRMFAMDAAGKTVFMVRHPDGLSHSISTVAIARNTSGGAITAGMAVYLSGSTGVWPEVAPAKADSWTTMEACGIAMEGIANNGYGRIMRHGLVSGLSNLPTASFSDGDLAYVSATVAGGLTVTAPTAPNIPQHVGWCIKASDGAAGIFCVLAHHVTEPHYASHHTGGGDLVNHDSLTGFVGNEHINHTSVTITTTEGIQGGGTIAANRTFKADISSLAADGTPDGAADYVMTYDASASLHKKVLLNNLPGGGGASTFLALTDTFGSYEGLGGQYVKVNAGENALETGTPAGAGDVTAAANLGDNLLIRGDGAGKGIQNSGIIVDDSNNLILPADSAIKVADGNPQIVFDNANNWLEITGSVGINTATPIGALDVSGNLHLSAGATIYGAGVLYIRAGSGGILHLGSNDANSQMVIEEGNVGIGTLTPAYLVDFGHSTVGDRDIGWGNSDATRYATVGAMKSGAEIFLGRLLVSSSAVASQLDYSTATNANKVAVVLGANGITFATKAAAVETAGAAFAWATTYARMTIDNTGKVGIGTVSPQTALHVDINADSAVYVGDSANINHGMTDILPTDVYGALQKWSGGSGGFSLTGLSESGGIGGLLFRGIAGDTPTVGAVTFRAGKKNGTTWANVTGTDKAFYFQNIAGVNTYMSILGNGNVGIGTTSPDKNLHIHNATAGTVTADANVVCVLENSTNTFLQFLSPNTAVAGIYFSDPDGLGGYIRYSHVDNDMQFYTAATTKVTINSAGNVGINTTAPADKLHVRPILYSNDQDGGIRLSDTSDAWSARFALKSDAGGTPRLAIDFRGTEAISIRTTSGQVGIGATIPGAKLDIEASSGDLLHLNGTGAGSAIVRFQDDGGETASIYTLNGSTSLFVRAVNDLYLDGGGAATGKLIVKADGSVGIGTTSPAAKLAINGGLHVGGDSDPGDDCLAVEGNTRLGGSTVSSAYRLHISVPAAQDTITTGIYSSCQSTATYSRGATLMALGLGAGNEGCWARATGGTAHNWHFADYSGNYSDTTAWHDASDPARKSKIRNVTKKDAKKFYALLDKLHLKGYYYKQEKQEKNWTAPERFGLMANDPDLPDFLTSRDRKGMAAGHIATYLVGVIQYQKELITDLEKRITQLEA